MHYIYNSYSLHYQVKPKSISLHYFMAILVRWFYFFNWKNKSSFQQLFIKICCLKSFTFSLHLKCTLNNSQHINSDDTYMWIINSLVLWKKMLTTKLHIFLSSEKYLIIITTPFLKWLWTLVKMERRGLVLSFRKGQSRDQDDGIERGCQEISLWQVRFFSEIHVMFSLLTDFVTLAIHLIFPQTILRLEIKMSDRTDSHWYVWLKKNEYWVHSVCVPQVSEKEGWQVSMQGGIPRRGNDTPFQTMLVWSLVFAIRWDKLFPFNSFFNDIQLTEVTLFRGFYLSSFHLCRFFPYPVLPSFFFQLLAFQICFCSGFWKKVFEISWEVLKTFFNFRSNRVALKCFSYETFINWLDIVVWRPVLQGFFVVCNHYNQYYLIRLVCDLNLWWKCFLFIGKLVFLDKVAEHCN